MGEFSVHSDKKFSYHNFFAKGCICPRLLSSQVAVCALTNHHCHLNGISRRMKITCVHELLYRCVCRKEIDKIGQFTIKNEFAFTETDNDFRTNVHRVFPAVGSPTQVSHGMLTDEETLQSFKRNVYNRRYTLDLTRFSGRSTRFQCITTNQMWEIEPLLIKIAWQ